MPRVRDASSAIRSASCTYNEIFEEKAIVTTDGALERVAEINGVAKATASAVEREAMPGMIGVPGTAFTQMRISSTFSS